MLVTDTLSQAIVPGIVTNKVYKYSTICPSKYLFISPLFRMLQGLLTVTNISFQKVIFPSFCYNLTNSQLNDICLLLIFDPLQKV